MDSVNPSLTGPVFRVDSMEHQCLMMEKRQLFLRSYQFSRKQSLSERIKRSFTRVKRILCFRLRSARRLRKLVCSRLSRFIRHRLRYSRRRSRFLRLLCSNSFCSNQKSDSSSSCFSCFS